MSEEMSEDEIHEAMGAMRDPKCLADQPAPSKPISAVDFSDKVASARRAIEDDISAFLKANGWKESSDYPGSRWLWSKSFPESKRQWRWLGLDKIPSPPQSINGATPATALQIECSWQELYDDGAAP